MSELEDGSGRGGPGKRAEQAGRACFLFVCMSGSTALGALTARRGNAMLHRLQNQ